MGFWDGEKCEYCDGPIVERVMDLPRKVRGRYVLVKNVPVGVCRECGTRFYAASVLKTLAECTKRRKAVKEITMPVFTFS